MFEPYDKECDTESICNGISGDAYTYLIKTLNSTKNIVVHWTQVEGTTSDYDIYYDFDPSRLKKLSHKEIVKKLNDASEDSNSMKYNIIRNSKRIPIKREEMLV